MFALDHPWNVLAVLPVALAVNQAHARVRRSRQETLHALETFANIVDERDPHTYRHSQRVAAYAFELGGGRTGHLVLPDDLVPLTVLALVYLLVSRGLLQVVGGLEVLQPDFAAAAAEAGLGAILAMFALDHPWNVLAVLPVALAVNQAHARVRRSRQETLHALETFANIVDERDPHTYRHSQRVAAYVDELARALQLSYSDIDRLRWAAYTLSLQTLFRL